MDGSDPGTGGAVLAVDTAGPVIGVGLRAPDGTTRVRTERIARGAETRLVPWALALLEEAGLRRGDVVGVAVAAGPGAFTGLRVGLATACGLAQGLGVPVASLSSLRSRAWPHRGELPVLAALDARKGRVYAALFDQDGRVRGGPGDVAPAVAVAWAGGPFRATGEGCLVYRAAVEAAGGAVVAEADDPCLPALAHLGALALARGEGRDPVQVRPRYLREADAVAKRR